MFTEEICKKLKNDEIEVMAPCMTDRGIRIDKDYEDDRNNLLELIFIADDPYSSHSMIFSEYQSIVRILNAIESELSEWKVVDNDNCYNPEKWETLLSYLERTGQKDNS